MADEILRSKHAFGSLSGIANALSIGKIDAYDILFLDGDTNPKIGWIDKDSNFRLVDTECVIVVDMLPTVGKSGKIYIFNDDAYFWNGTEFKPFCKPTDITELEDNFEKLNSTVVDLKSEIEKLKTDVSGLDDKVSNLQTKVDNLDVVYEKIKYTISHKPVGTLVNCYDKEIRVMCPKDTKWTTQQSGETADKNSYYIGFKAYAPSNDVVSFKEDLTEIIADNTMYYFENNEFAGVDSHGKYSIVWLPVAVLSNGTWTYHGEKSTKEKYIGWHYSVEWYNANGTLVATDCVRINLSNENCHSSITPFYISNVIGEVDGKIENAEQNAIEITKTYVDKQFEEVLSSFTIVEF